MCRPTRAVVTSVQNPAVAAARRLHRRRERLRQGAILLEGPHLVAEGLAAGVNWQRVFYTSPWAEDPANAPSWGRLTEVVPSRALTLVAEHVLAALAATRTPQGIVAVVSTPGEAALGDLPLAAPVVCCDGVQDPANVGAVLRAAFALGAGGALIGPDTADPYQPKALRAAAGMTLHLPLVWLPELGAGLEEMRRAGRPIIGLSAAGGLSLPEMAGSEAGPVLIIGSEGGGLSQVAQDWVSQLVTIPLRPGAESLNAATAAAIALYELSRRNYKI